MDKDEVNAKVDRGIPLLTTFLTSDGQLDEAALRSVLGNNLSDDDVIAALADMLIAARLVMMSYQVKTNIPPLEVLQEIALHRENKGGV